jgi:hypothetical protein
MTPHYQVFVTRKHHYSATIFYFSLRQTHFVKRYLAQGFGDSKSKLRQPHSFGFWWGPKQQMAPQCWECKWKEIISSNRKSKKDLGPTIPSKNMPPTDLGTSHYATCLKCNTTQHCHTGHQAPNTWTFGGGSKLHPNYSSMWIGRLVTSRALII